MARNIRRMRQQKSWSQHDLADEAGVRQALISSLEVATANPTLESLEKVASALNVSVADLLSGGG
jgi:transcriptional regulator with XRE-family HTH domain